MNIKKAEKSETKHTSTKPCETECEGKANP